MKKLKKNLYGFAAAAIAVSGLVSCSNTLDAPIPDGNKPAPITSPVTSPNIVSWSGSQVLANTFGKNFTGSNYSAGNVATRGVDVNGNLWYQNWERPTNVTEEEIAKVLEAVKDPRVNAKNDIHIDWTNYWVQQVYTGEATYEDGYGQNIGTGSSHMNHLLAYSNKVKEQTSWWPEAEFTLRDKYEYEDVYEHVNNFNSGSNNTVFTDDESGEKYYGTTLMTDMYAEGITDQFGYHNSTDSKNHFEYIILEIDGSYYVCFDFYATHPEGQEANKNMDVERDWIFNDWIVKISPATPKNNNGNTGGNGGNTGGNPGGDKPENTNPADVNEVEINLALLDQHEYPDGVKDLVSKLSIHVRYPHDVEVVMPMPEKFYCDQDDLYIIKDHYTNNGNPNWVYGGEESRIEYEINGQKVSLHVQFFPASNDNITASGEGYIKVHTRGINDAVIDYCRENFGDGINFEVYNYYDLSTVENQITDTYKYLQWNYLSRSYVNFDCWNTNGVFPNYYINAFNSIDGKRNPGDCYVWIIGDERANNGKSTYNNIFLTFNQRSFYHNAYNGKHYNNSPYNWIYTAKNVEGSSEPSEDIAMPTKDNWPFKYPNQIEY